MGGRERGFSTPGGLLPWIKFSHNSNYNSLLGAGKWERGLYTNITLNCIPSFHLNNSNLDLSVAFIEIDVNILIGIEKLHNNIQTVFHWFLYLALKSYLSRLVSKG